MRGGNQVSFTAQQVAECLYSVRWKLEDVERWIEWAQSKGCDITSDNIRLTYKKLERLCAMDDVPNEPFRRAYLADDDKPGVQDAIVLAMDTLAARDGKVGDKEYQLNGSKKDIERKLGVTADQDEGRKRVNLFIPYRLAEACCYAMGLDPRSCGI